jgi:hypothetical protein
MTDLTFTNILVFLKKQLNMRLFFTVSILLSSVSALAQPRLISQAIITTTTVITAGDNPDNAAPVPPRGAEGGPVIITRSPFDAGETKSTTYLKNNLVKTVTDNDMGRTSIIRDNNAQKTTTLMEMMGMKRGFYTTDADQEIMRKKMDSMMQVRNDAQPGLSNIPVSFELHYREESKKIAGYLCKKAVMVYTRPNGRTDSTIAWYNTEIKLKGINYTGGAGGGFMSFGRSSSQLGFDKIEGFIMQYEVNMPRGRIMTVTVNKIDIEKEVKDKEFDISKEYELKDMKDMQGPDGGMQIRIGGPGGH